VERARYADIAVESVTGQPVGKRRFRLLPAHLAVAATIIGTLLTGISIHRSKADTLQLGAEIARLNGNLQLQASLQHPAEQDRSLTGADLRADSRSPSPASAVRDSLKAKSEDLRNKLTSADGTDTDSLRRQLLDTQNRLSTLEKEDKFAVSIIDKYGPSVSLLHVVVEFLDKQSRKPLRVMVDAAGKPLVDHTGLARYGVAENGPPFLVHAFGTGFLASSAGNIITNRHVVEPWWDDHDLRQLLVGADPRVVLYEAFFPGQPVAIRAKLDRISSNADIASLKLQGPAPRKAVPLEFNDLIEGSATGEPVVLIGFPTGIDGILARAGSEVAQNIAGGTQDASSIVSQLASQHLIRPITTQGHIGDLQKDKIVHDAATTFGGSGAPLFNRDGKVIGINSAVIEGFAGSNLAVPAKYASDLLK
jgi:S1-C subfamily serine protease